MSDHGRSGYRDLEDAYPVQVAMDDEMRMQVLHPSHNPFDLIEDPS